MKLQKRTLIWGGDSRYYFVHVPQSYDKETPTPLVFLFHGGGGTASGMARVTGLFEESDKLGMIVVLPQGIKSRWNDGRKFKEASTRDDVGFINKSLSEVQAEWNVDSNAIYATGISNGGFFTQHLALKLPNTFAAVASVAASVSKEMNSEPTPPHATPIIFMLGTHDPLIPFNGGAVTIGMKTRGEVLSAEKSIEYWLRANNCSNAPIVEKLAIVDHKDRTTVTKNTYTPGEGGAQVIEYIVHGGGHTWPSGRQYLPAFMIGKVSRQLHANRIILDFFQAHKRR